MAFDEVADNKNRKVVVLALNESEDGTGVSHIPIVDSSGRLVLGTSTASIGNVDVLTEPSGSGVYTTPTHTNPTIANTTSLVLASNSNALYRLLANESGETIWIKKGVDAVLDRGIPIKNGGNYEMSKKLGNLYTGVINGICASGGKILLVTEGV